MSGEEENEIYHQGDYALVPVCGAQAGATKYEEVVNCPACLRIKIRETAHRLIDVPGERQAAIGILKATGSACGCACLDCLLEDCYACIGECHLRTSHSDEV